jgi:hypothetical protein
MQEEPETDVCLDEIFKTNETIFPYNIPYSPPDLLEQMLCE